MLRSRAGGSPPGRRRGGGHAGPTTSRREILRLGVGSLGMALAGLVATVSGNALAPGAQARAADQEPGGHQGHQARDAAGTFTMPTVRGQVNHAANGFDPTDMLTDFDVGKVTTLPGGQILHEYGIVATEKTIEVVPGVRFPAWTYNGRVPGPTFRVREGDRVRIAFVNATPHPHSMHFHGIHPGAVDGVFDTASGQVRPGGTFTYEFDAEPFGVHLYHCHTSPLAKHIAKGLYGAFIIEPKDGWPKADRELVMVINGIDVDFDGENDFYAVNTIPFHFDHDKNPIRIQVGELVRIFLVNILEYDPINSLHLHANFFHYYPTGTSRTPAEYTDTIALMQGQRGMLEFTYKHPGRYMFHAHKTEFAELGWTGVFDVLPA
jgi:FtsP/CotA-like multicopper oxidase with cupredoxin domain